MTYLKEFYPSVAICLFRYYKLTNQLEQYQQECRALEDDDHVKYSLYVYGYFIPWLEQQRDDGKLTYGKLQITNITLKQA